MKRTSFTLALLTALCLATPAAQDVQVDLQRAIQKEVATGDLKAAIGEYQGIVKRAGGNKEVAAKALIRMADAHRKLGDAEARRIFERVIREFPDEKEAVAHARAALSDLSGTSVRGSAPAARQLWVGADGMGSPSADGRLLSFTDWETGDLAIRDFSTNTSRRLTNTGGWGVSGDFAEFSVLSPDGKNVAYSWYTEREQLRTPYDLRVLPVAAGTRTKARVLHSDAQTHWIQPLTWTSDSQGVLAVRQFKARGQQLILISLVDGSTRTLKSFEPRWWSVRAAISPDGRYLAYDAAPAGAKRNIYLLDLKGGAEIPLVDNPSDDFGPFWSADGSLILFVSDRTGNNALWIQRTASGKPHGRAELLTGDIQGLPLGITAAGSVYYVKAGNPRNIYSAPLDGQLNAGAPTLITERFLNSNRSAVWSPDGRHVAFYTSRGGRNDSRGAVAVVIRRLDNGESKEIPIDTTVAASLATGLRWFPDGSAVLFVGRDFEQPALTFNRLDLTTGKIEQLHRTGSASTAAVQPDLSSDGKTIYFIDGVTGAQRRSIARLDLDGRTVTELKTGWFGSIAVSPDGNSVAFIGALEGVKPGIAQVGVFPARGGDARVLFEAVWTDPSRVGALTWSRDGRHVLFARPETQGGPQLLWRIPASGGAPEKTGISLAGQIKMPNVHPDGRRIAFTAIEAVPAELWMLENVVPLRGGRK